MMTVKKNKNKIIAAVLTVTVLSGTLLVGSAPDSPDLRLPTRALAENVQKDGEVKISKPDKGSIKRQNNQKKTLTLSNCFKLAYATDEKLDNLKEKTDKKFAEYESALTAAEINRKKLKTLSWKFMFSFQLPRSEKYTETYEFETKPAEKKAEWYIAQQAYIDRMNEIKESVTTNYIEIYKLRLQLETLDEKGILLNKNLDVIKKMMASGKKTEADVKEAEQKIKANTSAITAAERNKTKFSKKLAQLIGLGDKRGEKGEDPELVTYKLESPYTPDAGEIIVRDILSDMTTYSLDHDLGVYEARSNESFAFLAMKTAFDPIPSHYSRWDYSMIEDDYQRLLKGLSINKKSFKADYKRFLHEIDKYWEGDDSWGIWPIKFKWRREWFKFSGDGTWYMEDSPELLKECMLDYSDKLDEKFLKEDEKKASVEDTFDTFIEKKLAYEFSEQTLADSTDAYEKSKINYNLGETTAEEYNAALDNYTEHQNAMLDALVDVTKQVNTLNRVTCGYVDVLLGNSEDITIDPNLVIANKLGGAKYYIDTMYEQLCFEVGISIPDDFKKKITQFELWAYEKEGGAPVQIGSRTEVGQTIRHLMRTSDNIYKMAVRLYDGETLIDECEIDMSVKIGDLNIVDYEIQTKNLATIGYFDINEDTENGLATITMHPDGIENIGFFTLYDANGAAIKKYTKYDTKGNADESDIKFPVDKDFSYVKPIGQSINSITIKWYDVDGNELYEGAFDSATKEIKKVVTEE
ncbi:MAG: hypothetical protein K6F00_11585 [Lachnospiraceae bacterium]|nr:hypothetical protein [Lachnospiraceae bacterium]